MAKKAAEDARMAKLYREVVLKEKPVEAGFVPLECAGRNQAGQAAESARKRKKSAASATSFPSASSCKLLLVEQLPVSRRLSAFCGILRCFSLQLSFLKTEQRCWDFLYQAG